MSRYEQLTLELSATRRPTATDCIWAAAFLCGEGHVNITMDGRGDIRAQAGVTNNEMSVLEWYQELWGGAIYKHGKLRSKHDNRRRPSFLWSIVGYEELLTFLRDIRPYLKFKLAQTDNCIAFLELRTARRRFQRRSDQERSHDAEFLKVHRSLNLTHGRRKARRSSDEVRVALGLEAAERG